MSARMCNMRGEKGAEDTKHLRLRIKVSEERGEKVVSVSTRSKDFRKASEKDLLKEEKVAIRFYFSVSLTDWLKNILPQSHQSKKYHK